jgi:hypothetical protein
VKLRDGNWPAAVELGDESWPAAAAGSGGLRQWRSEKMGGWPRRNEDLVEEDGGNGERRRAAAVHTPYGGEKMGNFSRALPYLLFFSSVSQ